MAKRVRSFNYLDLHDEEFEELTFLLAHLEDPDLIKPDDPDLGLDGVVLALDGGASPRGFQAKHFTRAISWPQCRKSLDDAIANYAVKYVTFTFPTDLTGRQIIKFKQELGDRHPDVRVDFWGASQLTARLLGSAEGERIGRYTFGEDHYERLSRLFLAGQELDTAGRAISVLAATNNLFSDDPYFDYSIGTRPLSIGEAPPPTGTVMRVEVADEHGVRQIDAYAKPAALAADRLPRGRMQIAGENAVRRFQEFLRVGGELELQDVLLKWEHRPKYLEELLAGDSEEGRVLLQAPCAVPPRAMMIEIDTTTGRVAIDFDMQPTAPPEGWDHALVGQRGGTTMQMMMRQRGQHGELNLNWSWRMDASRSAQEHLIGVRFLEALEGEGELRILDSVSDRVAAGPSPQQPLDESMKILKHVVEDVVALENWLGQEIDLPDEITGADATAVHWIARLIEGVEGPWTGMNFTLENDPGEGRLSAGGLLQVRRPLWIDLFGERYALGDEATYINDFNVTASETTEGGGRKYVLEPATPEAKMRSQLERPAATGTPKATNTHTTA